MLHKKARLDTTEHIYSDASCFLKSATATQAVASLEKTVSYLEASCSFSSDFTDLLTAADLHHFAITLTLKSVIVISVM